MILNNDLDVEKFENALKENGIFVLRIYRGNWWLSNGLTIEFDHRGQPKSIGHNSTTFPIDDATGIDDIVKRVICIKHNI